MNRNLEPRECQVDTGQNKFLLELRKERGTAARPIRAWGIAFAIGIGVIGVIILSVIITM